MINELEQSCEEQAKTKERIWAKVYVESSEKSIKVCEILRETGFLVSTIPLTGLWEPIAHIEGRTYQGIEQISEFIEKYRQSKQNP